MARREPFEVDITCRAGGVAHPHVLVIGEDDWDSFGALPPRSAVGGATREIEYECPTSGVLQTAEFEPPSGYRWPFTVVGIE